MSKKTEIFENEEATKFLDYFVAYMKLMDKVDTIKNLASQQQNGTTLTDHGPVEPITQELTIVQYPQIQH